MGQEIVDDEASFGVGITGWAVENREPVHTNEAHLDPRVRIVQGTPVDPEALIVVPLIARGDLKGALNIYRVGDGAEFDADEFELAKRFGDAAALALDNAKSRAQLEHQAQTDALTGLLNHRYFHERLRAELQRASRSHLPVGLLMLDIDDFKRVNDIHGHAAGDEVLVRLADSLRGSARGSDVVCRIGGEEFAVILPETDANSASQLAIRMRQRMAAQAVDGLGELTVSIGFAEGPADASNPRELVACAEAAMMTAKASGKNRHRPLRRGKPRASGRVRRRAGRDGRSIAHLKLLQSLSGKLNRLNDVREIGLTIANELRSLIDYHNCRVFVVEGETVVPIAFRGELTAPASASIDVLKVTIGEGITGHVVATGRPILSADAARCEFAAPIPGTESIDESLLAVPMHFGTRVIGAIVISKLGFDQFDADDLRLLEVLAGQASVALENARLYEVQRREAETARTLLEFARELATAQGVKEVLSRTVEQAARIFGSERDVDLGRGVARRSSRARARCTGTATSSRSIRRRSRASYRRSSAATRSRSWSRPAQAPTRSLRSSSTTESVRASPPSSTRQRPARPSVRCGCSAVLRSRRSSRRQRPELRRSRRDVQRHSAVADERSPRSRGGSGARATSLRRSAHAAVAAVGSCAWPRIAYVH